MEVITGGCHDVRPSISPPTGASGERLPSTVKVHKVFTLFCSLQ